MDLQYAESRGRSREEPHGTFSELAYLDLIEAIIIDQLAERRPGHDGGRVCAALQLVHWV
jgi:hypothetical protein